ncbi:hypothetical protein CASFOL_037295 [Castilleja foliolosa]|uniref:Nucleosome assembly protein n=1 Tax=Castilleja foliolosa TaxID=1961234 RepID=A0ABD3BNK1_9LAMI
MGSNNKESLNVPHLRAALNADDKAELVNALKNRAGKVLKNLTPSVRSRVEELLEMQSQHNDLEANFFEERELSITSCISLIIPRYAIVNGAEVEVGATGAEPEEKGVPDFWLTAMKNNEVLVEERTEIEWLPGKCLTQLILKKKPKKGLRKAKPITKTEKCESFFNFFSPPEVPEEGDDIDEDAAKELQNLMEQDYDVGSTIRDKIIPHAVSWFTGEAAEDEFGDIEDEEDEDDDDIIDMFEDEYKTRKKLSAVRKKSGRTPAGDGQTGERPPECKQQ